MILHGIVVETILPLLVPGHSWSTVRTPYIGELL